jgi:hypothetical protein
MSAQFAKQGTLVDRFEESRAKRVGDFDVASAKFLMNDKASR